MKSLLATRVNIAVQGRSAGSPAVAGKMFTMFTVMVNSHKKPIPALGYAGNWAQLHTASILSAYKLRRNVKDCYQVLNVDPESSSLSDVKEAFLRLAKEYHPDSKSPTADVRKFNQVREAYQAVRADLEARHPHLTGDSSMRDSQLDFDIEHTAPQHRQYLEFEGIGVGTPSQRHKHYQKVRVQRAMNSVSERRMERLLVNEETSALVSLDKKAAKQIKTSNIMDRLVEDLIKDAMNKGEFENLPNKGKPLPDKTRWCPYWDVGDHNLNQVLVNNGYTPEWIQAEREIRSELRDLKDDLLKARLKLGPEPLNEFNQNKWRGLLEDFMESIKSLNKKVERRNLLVPALQLQIVHFRPEREIEKVLKEYDKLEETKIKIKEEKSREMQQTEKALILDGQLFAKIGDKIFQRFFFNHRE
ncbi:dnaJ homolog subfamily C member 28-like [Acanthaster planci]|uniref:DnaJ homolog subfamily C member 28-like n=1 Tax=Acanthaster planci TaxID=133434 RepID=A0A8B7ZEC1_ACAPL|nr:dnaJ homolog subfamily C member 28-like [Acanthaster planci]